ncbi:MAG: glycosyltransferase family 39 protein [Planctomycetales bacterium]|nr:glycosyltransferase family 39 protein [Planctomycetales bacterium]
MENSFPERRTTLLVLLFALLIRIAAAGYWHYTAQSENRLFRVGDSHSYWTLAENLGAGLAYQYGSDNARVFRAPLYPIVLAPFTWIPNSSSAVLAARILGCVFGTAAVGLLMILARRLSGARAAVIAGIVAACYPSAIGMSAVILSEAIFMPLMIANLLLWHVAWRQQATNPNHSFYPLAAGGVAGLAILARPSWLLFTPFASFIALVVCKQRGRVLWLLLLTCIGLSVTMSPWWIRNALITGKFVPTTLQVGPSLYDGWHAGATGSSDEGMLFMQDLLAEQTDKDALVLEKLANERVDQVSGQPNSPLESTLEWRINQLAMNKALAWAGTSPWEAAKLAVIKLRRTWSLWPDGGEVSSFTIRLALSGSCLSVLLLALVWSLRHLRQTPWLLGLCWVPCLYFSALHMVFVGSIRYREPAMFVLCAVAGCAIAEFRIGKFLAPVGDPNLKKRSPGSASATRNRT